MHSTFSPLATFGQPCDQHDVSLMLAAEAVLSLQLARAPLRVTRIQLNPQPEIQFALQPDRHVICRNRGLMEDVVTAALAPVVVASMLGVRQMQSWSGRSAREILHIALVEPEEKAALEAYFEVLKARTAVLLRRHWAEVQVVAAGLREHDILDASALRHRVQCAQGIRGSLMN